MRFALVSLAVALLFAIPAAAQSNTTPPNANSQNPAQPSQPSVSCQHASGHARIHVHVSKDGQPSNLKVVKSSGDPCLDQKAITAVSSYDFKSGRGFRPADFEIDVNISDDGQPPAPKTTNASPPPQI